MEVPKRCFLEWRDRGGQSCDQGCAFAHREKGKSHYNDQSPSTPGFSMACAYLEKCGFDVTYLPSIDTALLPLTMLKRAFRKETILILCDACPNNEQVRLMPIKGIGP